MIDNVLKLANEFMENPQHVSIDEESIEQYSKRLLSCGEINNPPTLMGPPDIPFFGEELDRKQQIIFYELLAGAVNYKYWYGKYNIRPNGSCANHMYKMLDDAFRGVANPLNFTERYVSTVISLFSQNLIRERFPMCRKRIEHLKEIQDGGYDYVDIVAAVVADGNDNVNYGIKHLVSTFPGYAQDMFLKRAFLFFMMLHRRMGWFKDGIFELPIPADYQIPKILRVEGCIEYQSKLGHEIQNGNLIPKGSLQECEIRAASIIACQKIASYCKIAPCDVDNYIWMNRGMYDVPFHLTMTTDY